MNKKIFLFCILLFVIVFFIFNSCSKSSSNPTNPSTQPVQTNTSIPDLTITMTNTKTISPTITFTYTTFIPTYIPTFTPTPTFNGGIDYFEPDDSYYQAKNISDGEIQLHSIHVWDDVDWIKFNVATDFEFSIITWGPDDPLTYIEVYKDDPTGPTYCTGGDGTSPAQILNYQFNEPGTYYIKIRPWNYESIPVYYLQLILNIYATATYTFTITPTSSLTYTNTPELPSPTYTNTLTPTPWPTDIYEPDDDEIIARPLTPGIEYNHTLHNVYDEDWFYFIITSPSIVEIKAGEDEIGYNKLMTIYNESLFPLFNSAGNPYAIDTHEYWIPGKYYVKIYPWNGIPALYNIEFSIIQFTHTNTPVLSPSPTFTPTYQMDAYEPDDTIEQAKIILNGETQIRSIVPRANDDFIKYECNGNEVITTYCSGDTNSYYKVDYLIATPDIFGYTREESTSEMEIVILEQFTPGPVYIRVQGDQSFSYSFNLVALSMTYTYTSTPTPTITETFTITETSTITQTHTFSPTSTITPTNTPKWNIVATYSANNLYDSKIYPNVSTYTYTCISSTSNFIVDGSLAFSNAVNLNKTGGKWFYCHESAIKYITFTDNLNNIYLRSSENWTQNIGGNIGTGYFPNVYFHFNTPYICYIDSTDEKIKTKYYDGSAWQPYDSTGHLPSIKHNIGFGTPLVLAGYPSDFTLYAAFINKNDGKLYCYFNGGSGWEELDINPVSDFSVYDIDMFVLNNSNIYVAYLFDNPQRIYVKKFNGTTWEDLGYNPVVETTSAINSGKNISIYANSENDIWIAYKTQYTYYYVIKTRKWNGNEWVETGSPDNLTGGMNPTIILMNNIPYVSFSDGSNLKIGKLE